VLVQQIYIEDVNNQFKAGITDPNTLLELLHRWLFLNDVRWIILTIMWLITMYFFLAKARQKVGVTQAV
jgi:hypothetical protein